MKSRGTLRSIDIRFSGPSGSGPDYAFGAFDKESLPKTPIVCLRAIQC